MRYPNIEAERVRKGMSRGDLSSKIGVARATYRKWQNGEQKMPVTALEKMTVIFGVPADYLIKGDTV